MSTSRFPRAADYLALWRADCDGDASPMETGNIVTGNADIMAQIKGELRLARVPVEAEE